MADTVLSALAYLQAWSNAFEQHYRGGIEDRMRRFGRTTRLIPMSKQRVLGNSLIYTVRAFHNKGTRVSNDAMAQQPVHTPGDHVTFTVTFDHTSAANNDFANFEIAFGTTIYDLWKRGDKTFKDSPDFIRQDVSQGLADVREQFAKYIHLNSTGLLATVVTTTGLKQADDDRWDTASAYSAGAELVLLKLDPTAIGRITEGARIDIWDDTDTLYEARNARVAYCHPYDNTIVVEIISRQGTTDDTFQHDGSTSLDDWNELDCSVTAGNLIQIFQTGSMGAAPAGTLSSLFDISTAYYGVARDAVTSGDGTKRILQPVRIDASAAGGTVPLTADLFRRVGEVAGHNAGNFLKAGELMMVMSKYEYRQIADFAQGDATI